MSRFSFLIVWVPLLFAIFFFMGWVKIYMNEVIAFEQYVMEKQVNYASEAAVQEMLSAALDMDYSDSVLTINPQDCYREYLDTLMMNWGIPATAEAMQTFANEYLQAMVICTYDGIYAFYPMENETHGRNVCQTPKIPYFYTNPQTGQQFCLTLDPKYGYWDYLGGTSGYAMHKFDQYANGASTLDRIPSVDEQQFAINKQVSEIVNFALLEANKQNQSPVYIDLPSVGDDILGRQPINSPTVIAVLEGYKRVGTTSLVAQTIGGATIEETRQIIGYTIVDWNVNGATLNGKFYAPQDKWNKLLKSYPQVFDNGNWTQGRYFDSVFEAASHGYNSINLLE